ncbi:MAG: dTMP kinase [Chloroflexi bacterium]|nr:dTMP kinase [Chloroflexota bacterium]
MSLFLSFEGGEGAGKTTQVALLAKRLQQEGYDVVPVREPGGTRLGEEVRRWVKGVAISPNTELLLFAAARAELVAQVIKPSLDEGKVVIADRYADSTVAYQGHGRRLPIEMVKAVNAVATGGLMPKLTLLLDQTAEEGLDRVSKTPQLGFADAGKAKRMDDAEQSKFEQENIAFHRRVRSGYLKMAGEEPQRILVVDATRPVEEIARAIWLRVEMLLRLSEHGSTIR